MIRKEDSKRFSLYGNTITPAQDRKALQWQGVFVKLFGFDPDEHYDLSVHDNCIWVMCSVSGRSGPTGVVMRSIPRRASSSRRSGWVSGITG